MRVKASIRNIDEAPVEQSLRNAGFVPCHQQDGPPGRIKRKGDAPNTAIRLHPQFLHVGVPRSVQCVSVRSAKTRPIIPENADGGKQGILHDR